MTTGGERERARHWRHPALPDVDLLRACYIGSRMRPGPRSALIEQAGGQPYELFGAGERGRGRR